MPTNSTHSLDETIAALAANYAEEADCLAFRAEKNEAIKGLKKPGSLRDPDRLKAIREQVEIRDIVPHKLEELEADREILIERANPLLLEKAALIRNLGGEFKTALKSILMTSCLPLNFVDESPVLFYQASRSTEEFINGTYLYKQLDAVLYQLQPNGYHWSKATPIARHKILSEAEIALAALAVLITTRLEQVQALSKKALADWKHAVSATSK